MIFDFTVLENKRRYLDSILATDLVDKVVREKLDEDFALVHLPRTWEPGGGATLFSIKTAGKKYFLKVKHSHVLVESRLESEPEPLGKPSLRNEYDFLRALNVPWVPQILFFEERDEYCFLALEWLDSFATTTKDMHPGQLLLCWEILSENVKYLYDKGIVHTDIHEFNILFRGTEPIITDFEEARFLVQDVPFTASLDYCGRNHYGDVGAFPAQTGLGIAGLTCLSRMRDLFKTLILGKLNGYLDKCRFDQSCPFNGDELQEEDARIYQSIDVAGISVAGQRPLRDNRKNVLKYFLFRQWQRQKGAIRHLDVGSNLGTFCLMASEHDFVTESIGLEAFDQYIEAANVLRFVADAEKVYFKRFICGESSLDDISYSGTDVCTMLSVYHHITSRDQFLSSLRRHRPAILLAEFATQGRYYPERKSLTAEIEYIRDGLGYRHSKTLLHSCDYHRPLVLFADEPPTLIDRLFMRLSTTPYFTQGMALLALAVQMKRRQLGAATMVKE